MAPNGLRNEVMMADYAANNCDETPVTGPVGFALVPSQYQLVV
jgi:hypothetical protein